MHSLPRGSSLKKTDSACLLLWLPVACQVGMGPCDHSTHLCCKLTGEVFAGHIQVAVAIESLWVQHPSYVRKLLFTVVLLVLWLRLFCPLFCHVPWALDVRVVLHISHRAWTLHSHLLTAFWPVVVLCGNLHLQQKDVSLLRGGNCTSKKALQFQSQRTLKHHGWLSGDV